MTNAFFATFVTWLGVPVALMRQVPNNARRSVRMIIDIGLLSILDKTITGFRGGYRQEYYCIETLREVHAEHVEHSIAIKI